MLSLILPPIVVVACVVFLVWIFWKKRNVLKEVAKRRNIPTRVFVPQENEILQEDSMAHAEQEYPKLGELVGNTVQAFFSFSLSILLKPFQRGRADRIQGKKERGIVSRAVKEIREGERNADAQEGIQREYVRTRPMISDEVTLPQKREEKKEYEQVLIERIAMNPRDVEAYERLGDYYLESGIFDDAKECFKQVLRLSPLSRRARFRMRRVEKILSGRR